MLKKLLPLLLATMCVLPPVPRAQSAAGAPGPKAAQLVGVAEAPAPDVTSLTAADREALQLAQLSSDPQLGDLRGGNLGLVVVLLLIILVIVIVD